MLERDTFVPRFGAAVGSFEGDGAGDAVRPVLRDLDRRRPFLIDLLAYLVAAEREAERTRGTRTDSRDEVVHATAARRDKRFLIGSERRTQAVRAEAGVGADASVVEDRDLLTDVRVTPIGSAIRILLDREADFVMAPVAVRLELRGAAAAERHLRKRRVRHAEPAQKALGVRDQVGAVVRGSDRRRQPSLDLPQFCKPRLGGVLVVRERELVRQPLQRGGGLEELVRRFG